jgi:hypothetical protein
MILDNLLTDAALVYKTNDIMYITNVEGVKALCQRVIKSDWVPIQEATMVAKEEAK